MKSLGHRKTEQFAQVYIASKGHIQSFKPDSLSPDPIPLIISALYYLEQGNTNENRRQILRTQRQASSRPEPSV